MLESRLLGNLYGRFGGGESEKYQQWQLAGFLSCGQFMPKPLWQRWHHCPCGIGPIQRDLYSAFLAAYLNPADPFPSCARYQGYWEGREPGLRAAYEYLFQRAREGQTMPRSVGIPQRQSATAQKSTSSYTRAHSSSREEEWETWKQDKEPPRL